MTEAFLRDGFVKIEGAFPAATAQECAALPDHGTRPRFPAQPPLCPAAPLELERADGAYTPVEPAIRRGLAGADRGGPIG